VLPGLVESLQNKVQATSAERVVTKRETRTKEKDDDEPAGEKDDDSVNDELDMTLQVWLWLKLLNIHCGQ